MLRGTPASKKLVFNFELAIQEVPGDLFMDHNFFVKSKRNQKRNDLTLKYRRILRKFSREESEFEFEFTKYVLQKGCP